MPILVHSCFNPGRGGHAPGDLRDAFADAVEAYAAWPEGGLEPRVELQDQPVPISRVFGLLHNCTDIMPRAIRDEVRDLVPGEAVSGSYAAGAQVLSRRRLASARAAR
jgi:hypothetical protein